MSEANARSVHRKAQAWRLENFNDFLSLKRTFKRSGAKTGFS
jgi:hypothetical protein